MRWLPWGLPAALSDCLRNLILLYVSQKAEWTLQDLTIILFPLMSLSCTQVAENRCKKVCTSKSDLRTNDFSIVGSLPRDFELSNFDCYGKPIDNAGAAGKSQSKNNKKPPPPKPVIPSAAKRVDLYARALFPFTFLFFNVIYWSVYLWLSWNDLVLSIPHFTPLNVFIDHWKKFNSKVNIEKRVLANQNDGWEQAETTMCRYYYIYLHIKVENYHHLCIKMIIT